MKAILAFLAERRRLRMLDRKRRALAEAENDLSFHRAAVETYERLVRERKVALYQVDSPDDVARRAEGAT